MNNLHNPICRLSAGIILALVLDSGAAQAATKNISTVVGGGTGDGLPATATNTFYPLRSTLDASGNLYFGDVGAHRVYRIAGGTGILTIAAGDG